MKGGKGQEAMERMAQKIDLLKVKAINGRPFNAPAVCKPVASSSRAPNGKDANDDGEDLEEVIDADGGDGGDGSDGEDGELPIDAYAVFDNRRSAVFPPEFNHDMERVWDRTTRLSYEEERRVSPVDIEQRVKTLVKPAIVARGSPPVHFTCRCCGERSAHDLQLPHEVFATAYCVAGPVAAIQALVSLAQLLVEKKYEEAIKRCCVCRQVRCMIAQHKLPAEDYYRWYWSGVDGKERRKQLERGTDRKNQGVNLDDNVLLLR